MSAATAAIPAEIRGFTTRARAAADDACQVRSRPRATASGREKVQARGAELAAKMPLLAFDGGVSTDDCPTDDYPYPYPYLYPYPCRSRSYVETEHDAGQEP